MEKYKAIVASNMLRKIEELENVLKNIYGMEEKNLQIRTDKCPYCVPLPTITLRDKVYELIKTHYEDELADIKNSLKEL